MVSSRIRRFAVLTAVGGGLGIFAEVGRTQSPAPVPTPTPASPAVDADYATRPVAYIHGSTPVTRQELGEFLMARGGADKVELLVNKRIIEIEAQKRGFTVTDKELEAALMDDLEGLSIKKSEFVKVVLPRYGKSLYEWMEDVVRPRLMLTKLCRDRIKIEEPDLQIQFEREYGEKRRVQVIMWPPHDDKKAILASYEKLRASQTEFDSAARSQGNAGLAAAAGHIKPVSKHLPAQDKIVEDRAFQLKVGELSEVLSTSQGYMVMKLHEIIPPATGVKFEDVKARLEKQAFDERMGIEVPKYFAELKKAADPKVIFTGPSQWQMDAGKAPTAEDLIKGVTGGATQGVVPASGTAPPMPNR